MAPSGGETKASATSLTIFIATKCSLTVSVETETWVQLSPKSQSREVALVMGLHHILQSKWGRHKVDDRSGFNPITQLCDPGNKGYLVAIHKAGLH